MFNLQGHLSMAKMSDHRWVKVLLKQHGLDYEQTYAKSDTK